MRKHALAAATAAVLAAALPAHAGTYKTINIDNDYSDWSDVPIATTVSANTGAGVPIDFNSLQLANDDKYLYIHLNFVTATNPQGGAGVFTAIDSNANPGDGFNIYDNPTIGANLGFQNDFVFTQAAHNFNSGGTKQNGDVTGGYADTFFNFYLASPYNSTTTDQEIAIPLNLFETDNSNGGYTGYVFQSTIRLEFYTTDDTLDTLGPVTYDLAVSPEPTSMALIGLGAAGLLQRRRGRKIIVT